MSAVSSLLVGGILLGLLPGCALMSGRHASRTVRLEHASGRQVCDALEQESGPATGLRVMDRSVRDPEFPPNAGVDASGATTIVVWVEDGCDGDLERALEIVRAVDGAAGDEVDRRSGIEGGSVRTSPPAQLGVPDGEEVFVLRHADARDVAQILNELAEESCRKAWSRGCVLYAAPEVIEVPRPSCFAWDARTLVVLEPTRDGAYLPAVRELVARLDGPELAPLRADQ